MNTTSAFVKLFCTPSCGYVSEEIPITIFSDKTCHVTCSKCKTEILHVYYKFYLDPTGKIYLHQEQKYLLYDQKKFRLHPGDTFTTTYEDFIAVTKTIITLLF